MLASGQGQAHQRTFALGSQNQDVTAEENISSTSQIFKRKMTLRAASVANPRPPALISGSVPAFLAQYARCNTCYERETCAEHLCVPCALCGQSQSVFIRV
jgi:hypothetical protein